MDMSAGALRLEAGVAARLERLPMTGYQRSLFGIIATAWFFDSMDLGLMTFVLGSIKAEFGLTAAQAGMLASSSFLGMFLGAAIAGLLADRFGRKPVFQVSMIFWGVGSLMCGLADNVTTLMLYRVLLGFGMGMEFPIGLSMVSEIVPAKSRGKYVAILEGFWPIGFIAAGAMTYFLLPMIGWRGIFIALAVPAVFVFVVRRMVPESPRWLEDVGRKREADAVMAGIEQRVERAWGRALPPVAATYAEPAAGQPEGALHGTLVRPLRAPHDHALVGLVLRAARLLRADHLARGAAPAGRLCGDEVRALHGLHLAGGHSRVHVLGMAAREMGPQANLRADAARQRRRRVCVRPGGGAQGAGGAADRRRAVHAVLPVRHVVGALRLHPELYPTRSRATGSGFASSIGRIGSLAGPYLVGVLLPVTGQGGGVHAGSAVLRRGSRDGADAGRRKHAAGRWRKSPNNDFAARPSRALTGAPVRQGHFLDPRTLYIQLIC